MMKRLAIATIAAALLATMVSLPRLHAHHEEQAPLNPQGPLAAQPFADVPPEHWAYNAVEYLRLQGLVEGYPDRTFKGKRPMTRYEFAQTLARMIPGMMQEVQRRLDAGVREIPPAVDGVTQEELAAALAKLRGQIPTEERIRAIAREIAQQQIAAVKPAPPGVSPEAFSALQRLSNEFRDELARLGVDVDALRRDIADMRSRMDAVEAELARRPLVIGNANVIGRSSWKGSGVMPPAFDQDGRPIGDATDVLAPILTYYDLDLGIVAQPAADVRVGVVLNVGNYLSADSRSLLGPDSVTPYKMFVNVPFRFLGTNDLTLGRQGTQLTRYTFKAVDPDVYTSIPREDSGEVIFWGINTNWQLGSARLRAFAGADPRDGRLLQGQLNVYNPLLGVQGLETAFGTPHIPGATPIRGIGNFAGARLTFGEPGVSPLCAQALPVGAAAQLGIAPAGPMAPREIPTAVGPPAADCGHETAEVESGITLGPIRNAVLGVNWLLAGNDAHRSGLLQDPRAQVFGVDARFNLAFLRIEGEWAHGRSDANPAGIRSLDNGALDVRGSFNLGRSGIQIGAGYRRIELGYLVPGAWGQIGSWKNPRGIEGPMAQVRVPVDGRIAPFLRNLVFTGSGEWYSGARDLPDLPGVPVNEQNLRIDRYMAGVQFGITPRNTVNVGWEQVFRNYVPAAAGQVLNLPTMGVGGSPLVGDRIKNTETYLNFGIGHNFTPNIAAKLLYQLVNFDRFDVDRSNQPANYRGYVASAQVGVRF